MVAYGDFGLHVAERLRSRVRTRSDERRPDLAIFELDSEPTDTELEERQLERVEASLIEQVRHQLALSALVERAPDESSPPWLDVFIVADLAEPLVRGSLDGIIERIHAATRDRFSNLFGDDGARLVIIPLLALGESLERSHRETNDVPPLPTTADLATTLARRATPRVRPFLLEAQTSRYILSGEELVSTTVAMVELLVLAGLRESEQLAEFLRGAAPTVPSSAEPAPFGTFGVASVHVDAELVRAYCQNRASLAIVEAMRAGADLGLEEREELARTLRLEWDEVRNRLGLAAQSDAAFEQVEKIVLEEAPRFPCPEIDVDDSPEEVRERKFGDDWYRSVGGAIDKLIERLERRRMQELASKIDAGGLSIARQRRQRIRDTVDSWVWRRPRGWAAARNVLALLRDEAANTELETKRRIASISLPVMPTPEQLHRPVIALRDETERRPRPFRLWMAGVLLSALSIFFGYKLLSLLEFPLEALDSPSWLVDAVTPPYGALLAAVIAIPIIAFSLYRMRKKRHEELVEVRDELERSIEKLVTGRSGSVLAYYLARLELARELWVLRLAGIDRRFFEEELQRLDEVQRALDTLWDQYRASQRRLGVRYLDDASSVEDLSQIRPRGDLILREAADGELLDTTYQVVARDEEDLPTLFFEQLREGRPQWRLELPMAERQRIEEFLAETLELPGPGELLGSGGVANETAQKAIAKVFQDLLTRLTPSLGLTEASIDASTSWVIWAPKPVDELVDNSLQQLRETLDFGAFGSNWLRLTSPRDDGRVYLAVLVTQLPTSAIGALSR